MIQTVDQEVLLHQVMTGVTRCLVVDVPYYIHAPSPAHKMEAAFVYKDMLYECSFGGVLTDEEMLQVMIDNDLWNMDEEAELNSIPTRLDALKVDMFTKYVGFQSKRVEKSRRMVQRLRKRQYELAIRRHEYDFYTQTGLARMVQMQYLIARNTKGANKQPIDLEIENDWLIRQLLEVYSGNRPDELQLRSLARYAVWRMIWASGRQEGRVFGVPSIRLTQEQQNLIAWSKLYDNVHEHPEPPDKEVIEDNDLLDGWIICEQNKREKERRERSGGDKQKPGAQEMYVMAETADDAKRIEAMNDPGMAFVKRQRMAALKQKKVVGEQHMPDSQQKISVQAAQQFRDRMKQPKRRR